MAGMEKHFLDLGKGANASLGNRRVGVGDIKEGRPGLSYV